MTGAEPNPTDLIEVEFFLDDGLTRTFQTNHANAAAIVGMLRKGQPIEVFASDPGDPRYFCFVPAKGATPVRAAVLRPCRADVVELGVPLIQRAADALAALVVTPAGKAAVEGSEELRALFNVLFAAVDEG